MINSELLSSAAAVVYTALLYAPVQAQVTASPTTGQAGSGVSTESSTQDGSSSGLAQASVSDDRSSESSLADIVVTAQRRSENLQRVPVTVAVATASDLVAGGVPDIASLKMVTPGVEVQNANGTAVPIIRGVGSKATGPGIEAPIALYIDGVYVAVASASLLQFNNIEQIEVLKGPQGTLFGRNATGGLIQIITRTPSQNFEGNFNVSYGNYQTLKGDAYIAGPLADNAAIDLAVVATHMGDGYGKNLLTGKDVYRVDHDIAVRSKLVIQAGDDTEIRIIGDYNDKRENMYVNRIMAGTTVPAPYGPTYGGRPWDAVSNIDPILEQNGFGFSGKIDQNIGQLRLASITAWSKSKVKNQFDVDLTATDGRILHVQQSFNQFSQELQLLSADNNQFTWVLGGYYFNAKGSNDEVRLNFNGPAAIPTVPPIVQSDTFGDLLTDSISGFGQGSLKLGDLTLTAGLRYTSEKKSLKNATSYNTRGDGSVAIVVPLVSRSVRFNKLTWRFAASYQFTQDSMAYVSYNRGFKSGGFNPNALTLPPFDPEVLDAYELGFKTSLLDRRVRFNAAAFYYDYGDVQVQRLANGVVGIYNGGAAEIYGADAELEARITSALNLKLGYQYVHGEYTEFPGAVIASPRAAGGYNVGAGSAVGNVTVFSPKSTLSAVMNYIVPVSPGEVKLNLSYYYNSGFFHEPDNAFRQSAYSLVNGSIRFESRDGYSVTLWGNNLTNKAVQQLGGLLSFGATGAQRANYGPPRTYGVTLGASF